MARIHRKHFQDAVEAGIASCPILHHPALSAAVRTLRQYSEWQDVTVIGAFVTDDDCEHQCPLVYAGLVAVLDDRSLHTRWTESTEGVLASYAELAPFWEAFDDAARPHVTGWDGDPSVPIRIITP